MQNTFLMSTFTCLLQLTVDAGHRLVGLHRWSWGHGIYYGLTRGRDRLFVAARNQDADLRVHDPALTANNVLVLPWPWRDQPPQIWAVPGGAGLHQIRFHDGLVWMVNCRPPELLAVDAQTGNLAGQVPLAEMVPAELQHDAPPEHPEDRFHFNSLFFAGDRLLVLAHNGGRPSFVVEMDYPGPEPLFRKPHIRRIHTNLGVHSHDVFSDGDRLIVLDSRHGRLIGSDGAACSVGRPESQQKCFARGLAVNSRHFYVGHGGFAGREGRYYGPSQITVVDRQSMRTEAVIDVGPYGNPCDLLLVSGDDLSD